MMEENGFDKAIIRQYLGLLRDCKSVSSSQEIALIRNAFRIANENCKTKELRWGEPVILHSTAISRIVGKEIGLSTTSIIAALLMEFIEDGISIEFLRKEFGNKVAEISEGLIKIAGIEKDSPASQAENLRNLMLTLVKDVRVILIKIAERLYIMRNLDKVSQEDQIRFASETRFIFSPLAHRMGLYNIMSELEDISLKYLEPEAYKLIDRALKANTVKRNRFIRDFIQPLQKEIEKNNLNAEIKGRPKATSSIWRKMKRQKVDINEVYDKFAIRIILDSNPKEEKSDCWRTYSIVTDLYRPNPDRLRDWISVPKSNGYESLHTTVVVPGGEWVEVQIRSRRMDEIAEKGLAAHWRYKGIKGEAGIDEWLARIRELLNNSEANAINLIDDLKLSLDNKEIFVFTPAGELKKFPEGATVLDFAFDIHTAVGVSCMGAKVNGKNVPIRYKLKNGDRVEIKRSKNQKPNIDWLNYVASSKAKSKIRQALKEEKLKEAENGKEMLVRRFKNWKLEFKDPYVRKLIHHYKYNDATDMYYDIATEKLDLLEIKEIVTAKEEPVESPKQSESIEEASLEKIIKPGPGEEDYLIIDDKVAGLDYRIAKCCNPIPGDDIFGFVTINSGITIHRINCPNAHQLISRYGYRIVKARWTHSGNDPHFLARIKVTGEDDLGIVSNISEVISTDLKVNMRSFNMNAGDGLFEGYINLYVKDTSHLDVLIRKLTKVKGVLGVRRIE